MYLQVFTKISKHLQNGTYGKKTGENKAKIAEINIFSKLVKFK